MKLSILAIVVMIASSAIDVCAIVNPTTTSPASPGYSQADYDREILALNRKELVDAYQVGGRHNAKWDVAATAGMARGKGMARGRS
jgi:hypothetical protein